MRKDKNYLASLLIAIGTFVLLPTSIMSVITIFKYIDYDLSSFQITNLILSFLIVIVFVAETTYLIISRKEDKFGKTFSFMSLILNALLTIVAVLLFILMAVEMFRVSSNPSFSDVLQIFISISEVSIISVVSATAFGIKLSNILKK